MNYLKAIQLPEDLQRKNHEIKKVYFEIIEAIKLISRSFNLPGQRTRVEIDHTLNKNAQHEVYEVLMPYLFLCLNADEEGIYSIYFATNESAIRYIGQSGYQAVQRAIYQCTAASSTKVNIEDQLTIFPYYEERYQDALEDVRNQEYDFYTLTIEQPLGGF